MATPPRRPWTKRTTYSKLSLRLEGCSPALGHCKICVGLGVAGELMTNNPCLPATRAHSSGYSVEFNTIHDPSLADLATLHTVPHLQLSTHFRPFAQTYKSFPDKQGHPILLLHESGAGTIR